MTQENVSFRDELLQDIALLAAELHTFKREAFATLVLDRLIDNGDIQSYEHCYFEHSSSKGHIEIDAYSIDDTDGSISLFLFDLNHQEIQTINSSSAMNTFKKLIRFIDGALSKQLVLDISTPAYELADIIYRRYHNIELTDVEMITQKYKLFYFSTNPTSERFKYTIDKTSNHDKIFEYNVWDINRLESNWQSTVPDQIEIDLQQYVTDGLPYLRANVVQESDSYQSFLCIIPGRVLADLYIEHGSKLLEGNVRSYLSATRKVNRGIRNTAINDADKFFVYNNGISATASAVQLRQENQHITHITNLQIVNGAQTTATLAEVRRSAAENQRHLSNVFVQMKLTVVDSEHSETLIPNISRYSNSQNSVSEADFFANHPYHLEIEKLSRRILAPAKPGEQYETNWYYERLRAQYINDVNRNRTKRERDIFVRSNPKSQIITKTDLAKVLGCWQLVPHMVSRGAQTNFQFIAPKLIKLWDEKRHEINEWYFQNLVAMSIVYRSTQTIVSAQSWYGNAYRANIVAYTISKLVQHIKVNYPNFELNLQAIWRTQQISDLLSQQIALIAKTAFDVLTNPPYHSSNVTQWAKRDACWTQLEKTEISEVAGFASLLMSSEDIRTLSAIKRIDQKFVNDINALTELLDLRAKNPDVFIRVRDYLKTERITISPRQAQTLVTVSNPSIVPTERQAVDCMKLLQTAEKMGFQRA